MTRRALWIAAALAVLTALYAAAGWLLAPRYLRGALAEAAAARGLELRLGAVRTDPFRFAVELRGVQVHAAGGRRLAAARAIAADLAPASLWRGAWIFDRAEVSAPALDFAQELPVVTGGVDPPAQARPFVIRELLVTGGTLELPRAVTLRGLRASVQGLSSAANAAPAQYAASAEALGVAFESRGQLSFAPFALRDFALQARAAEGGSAALSGAWDNAGRTVLRLEARSLALARLQPFLPERFAVLRIASGAASAQGRLELGEEPRYVGSLAVEDLRLDERESGRLLLAWKRAQAPALSLSRGALHLGEVEVEAPQARLVVEEGGRFNFAAAFSGGRGGAGRGFSAAFEELRVRGGTLHFIDRTPENAFETTVVELEGTVRGFSTAAGEPAQVRLDGRVPPYGTARIRGSVDLDSPSEMARVTARLRNLRMEAFNPYVTRFAGYRIESGRVSATLRYALEDGRLRGDNDLVFEEMRLGERVRSPRALDLPLELAVAVLADAEGRITLDVPVSGNLRDPHFDFGAIVARAVGNTLRRIVTAPFRALAALAGAGDEDLGKVAFAPGRAGLSPPGQERIARAARALAARPRLGVAVRGGYDPERDLRALRLCAARDLVLVRAGADRLDLDDARVRRAAEVLFLQRAGSRAELARLRGEAGGGYGRALLQRLAESLDIGDTALDVLARARAEAVRDALVANGLDARRIRIDAPRATSARGEGIVTELALLPGATAVAGR